MIMQPHDDQQMIGFNVGPLKIAMKSYSTLIKMLCIYALL